MKIAQYLFVFFISLTFACRDKENDSSNASLVQHAVFFDKLGMDTTIAPGDNFFLYANGTWIKDTEIPKTQTGWGSFYILQDENRQNLNKILKNAYRSNSPEGSIEQKVGDFYHSGMDTVTIEKLGISPMKTILAKIDSIKNNSDILNFIVDGASGGYNDLLGFSVNPDDKNSLKNIATFTQSGITLPDRSYYLENNDKSKKIRTAYLTYLSSIFQLAGDSLNAKANAIKVLALETKIAKSHITPVQLRDPEKNYNKFLVADFQKRTSTINWTTIFKKLEITPDSIVVRHPNYYKTLGALIKSQPIVVWKLKLKFDALNTSAPILDKKFRDARFEFFGKTLNGQIAPTERWKAVVNSTDTYLGDLLGQLYTEQYFKPEAKKRMLALVDNLQKVYVKRIQNVGWMSAETKLKAIDKLNIVVKKIGYPEKWKDFDEVKISPSSYYENIESAKKNAFNQMLAKLDKPVDKADWNMTTPTVNAYYNPSFNEIVFPAGILQFPFFDFNADDAINYGAIGVVIGHEMTHGFDDEGRQYNGEGNLKNWWTKADSTQFKSKTDKVVEFYNKFTLFDNQHVNGRLTLGENLADIGGLQIAYDAFKLTEQSKSNEEIDGLTPDQRFFLSFAQIWRMKNKEEMMRVRLKTDPHSPEMFRVNGPVYNIDAFYKAFDIKNTAKMFIAPQNRLGIW